MNKRTLILVGVAAAAAFFPQARAGQEPQKPNSSVTAPASQETISLEVTGMTWPVGCVSKVRSALSKVPGVVEADVALPNKADVKVQKGKVSSDQLIKAIKGAGYSAKLKQKKTWADPAI